MKERQRGRREEVGGKKDDKKRIGVRGEGGVERRGKQ